MTGSTEVDWLSKVLVVFGALIFLCVLIFAGYESDRQYRQKLHDVYQEGLRARRLGVPVVANPYKARRWGDNRSYELAWQYGWMGDKEE